jgi:hypothetical protein
VKNRIMIFGPKTDGTVTAAGADMSDEAKKEGRDWTAVPVAVYSLVIFVLLFLYVKYF